MIITRGFGEPDYPDEEDVEVGVTYDNETKTGTYLGLTGNNLTATLQKSVTLIGQLKRR